MKYQHNRNKQYSRPYSESSRRYNCLLSPISCLLTPVSCLLILGFTGCISLPKPDLSSLKPPGPVTSVIATWEPAISNGDAPERGFGGRVYFHDQDARPAKINGTVVVYAFDEDGRAPGDSKPTKRFIFDEKMLNSKEVYTKTKMGHSYSLWVPWDAAGPEGQAKKVSLFVRYIPKQGEQKMSQQATVHLPGKRDSEKFIVHQSGRQEGSVQEVAASRLASERMIDMPNRSQTMETVTIR